MSAYAELFGDEISDLKTKAKVFQTFMLTLFTLV